MKRLRPNWVNGQDETQTELDAEAEAEQGLEELADLFATELQELQQQAAPSSAPVSRRKKSRKQLVTVDFGSQDVGGHPTDHDSSVCEKVRRKLKQGCCCAPIMYMLLQHRLYGRPTRLQDSCNKSLQHHT
jgi:hypothetical protein